MYVVIQNVGPNPQYHGTFFRKQHIREVKLLQREEQKQGMELIAKIRRQWDAQEQKFDFENAVCYLALFSRLLKCNRLHMRIVVKVAVLWERCLCRFDILS